MEGSMSGMSERTGGSPMNVAVFHYHYRYQMRSLFDLSTLSEVNRSRNRQENMAFSSREVVEGLLLYAFVRSSLYPLP